MNRACRKCGTEHPVFYFVNTEQRHLVMVCENNGNNWTYLPYEDGLPVPVVYSKNYQDAEDLHRELDRECDSARDRDRR
jgi:hypothetical protein